MFRFVSVFIVVMVSGGTIPPGVELPTSLQKPRHADSLACPICAHLEDGAMGLREFGPGKAVIYATGSYDMEDLKVLGLALYARQLDREARVLRAASETDEIAAKLRDILAEAKRVSGELQALGVSGSQSR